MRRLRVLTVLGIPSFLSSTPDLLAQLPTPPQAVVLSNTNSPAGGKFSFFGATSLNQSGQVLFRGDLSGASSPTGLFTANSGSIQTVGLRNGPAPTGGNFNSFFSDYRINASGQVAFRNTVTPSSQTGLFMGSTTVALTGTASPIGGTYSDLSNNGLAFNNSGAMVYRASLSGASGSNGLFVHNSQGVAAAAINGAATPAAGNYGTFSDPTINATGVIAFRSIITGSSSTAGIFAGVAGNIQSVAVSGTPSPIGGNYLNFNAERVGINAAGQVAFASSVTSGSALFSGLPGSLSAVAQTGDATAFGGTFSGFSNPVINSKGQVAFSANVRNGSGTTIPAIFAGTAGSVQGVALEGTSAPGGGTFFNLFTPSLNGMGQVAFSATLTGTSTATNEGLYAGLPGNLQLVVRKGDVIDVDPGASIDLRTVSDIQFALDGASGGEDGQAITFADDGTIVYRLSFTDNSSGIFISVVPVPEPATTLMIASSAYLVGFGCRRFFRNRSNSRNGAPSSS